jgi:putative ABC transport system substrate-binding protein
VIFCRGHPVFKGDDAQQRERKYRIVVLSLSVASAELTESGSFPQWRAFFKELRRFGYEEGRNLSIVRLSAEDRAERHPELIREAVALQPDVIFAVGLRFMRLLKQTISTSPVVGIATDPVGHKLVESLARPGGNMTGVSLDAGVELLGKRLELLKEMEPRITRVGYLAPQPGWEGLHGEVMERLARQAGLALLGPPLESPLQEPEYRRVFAIMANSGADAVFISDYAENFGNRRVIGELAAAHRLPAIHALPGYVEVGGLMEYAPDLGDVFKEAAALIDRILKGESPTNIPFVQPTKFALRINLKAAMALGLTIPPTLLARADEVIE